MILNFEHLIGGEMMSFCASLGEGESKHRVIISREESAETLVVLDASGLFGAIRAEIEAPDVLLADAVRKAKEEGLIERAFDTGLIQNATL
ncbi:MAG TPA: hypothetical protein VKS80_15645 [Trinickia sp.]|nr:hypothetical protein [Trinickia sp.]